MASCRNCEAPILWGKWSDSGKFVALDPEVHPEGNVIAVKWEDSEREGGEEVPTVLSVSYVRITSGKDRYMTHSRSCSEAPVRPKPRPKPAPWEAPKADPNRRPVVQCPKCEHKFVAPKRQGRS